MRRFGLILALLCLLVIPASFAWTQDQSQQSQPANSRRDDAIHRLEMVRLYRLVELLELNSEESARLFPVIQKYDQQFREIMEQKEQAYAKLNELVKQTSAADSDINRTVDEVLNLEQKAMKIRESEYRELRKQLTADQTAKFLLFEKRFQVELQRLLNDVRNQRAQGKVKIQQKKK
jgi:Spy/CpxP family protein refolding chaperone